MKLRYLGTAMLLTVLLAFPNFAQQHIVIQAEDASTIQGKLATNHNNYTGTGFIDLTNAVGSYIEFKFSIKDAGADTLFVFYAHGKTGDRPMSISVNDSMIVPSMSFNPTASYDTWVGNTAVLNFRAGVNVVRLASLVADGGPNLDRFEIAADPGSIQYQLVTNVIGRGSVTRIPDAQYYDAGTKVVLTAVAQTGAAFDGWVGALTGTVNPDTVIMDTNKIITANFLSLVHASVYCSPAGNDTSGTGEISNPYYSLAKAVTAVQPGDTIFMRGGTYNYTATVMLTKAGSDASRLVIMNYPGEKPILSWAGWIPANETERGSARGIKVTQSARYWYLKGLEISYAPDNGVKCEGAHTTFEQCIFHHNGDGGLQIGLGKDSLSSNPDPENLASYTRVINCDAYRNADPGTDYENADGFSCKLYAGYDNYFYGCRAWENCDDGWDCYQTNYQITIDHCWAWHNGDPTMWGFTSFNGDGNGFKLGGNDEPCPITISNCVAFNSIYGAVCCYNDNNNGSPVTVLNCTGWNGGKIFKFQTQAHILKNCVAFDPKSGKSFTRDLSSSAVSINNTWDLTTVIPDYADFAATSEEAALAPREADGSLPRNGFAKLVPGSDLIDKGIDVGLPYFGSAPDLGAYEFDPTLVSDNKIVPAKFNLAQNYPNPFNPSTVINYQLPENSHVVLKIYNSLGKEIATLVNEEKAAGSYDLKFNASNLASGLYFYSIKAGNTIQTRKMLLIK